MLFVLLSFVDMISQEVLDNNAVLSMVEMEFDDTLIIDKIENSENTFDTSISVLGELKKKGVSQSVLSAMIKSSKKEAPVINEEVKKASPPKPNDLEFYWENGKGELVKVTFGLNIGRDFTIDETELAIFTDMIMLRAKMELKVPSSFNPSSLIVRKRLKTDKYLTSNDKTTHVVQLGRSGTNLYGGVVDGVTLMGVNPNLIAIEKSKEELYEESTASKFTFKKIFMGDESFKMKGEIMISKKYLFITYDNQELPRISIKDKKILGENHWKSITDDTVIEYKGNETKYKNEDGVLIVSSGGYEQIYLLIKSDL